MTTNEVTFGGLCCFCGAIIHASGPDPVELTVTAATGKWQVWWCHAACFKQRLTDPPGAEGFFAPAHF